MFSNLFWRTTPPTARGTGIFFLYPGVTLYDDMTIIGLSTDAYSTYLYLENNVNTQKNFMIYEAGINISRRNSDSPEHFQGFADSFQALQCGADRHELFFLNTNEYNQFFTALDKEFFRSDRDLDTLPDIILKLVESIQHLKAVEEAVMIRNTAEMV